MIHSLIRFPHYLRTSTHVSHSVAAPPATKKER